MKFWNFLLQLGFLLHGLFSCAFLDYQGQEICFSLFTVSCFIFFYIFFKISITYDPLCIARFFWTKIIHCWWHQLLLSLAQLSPACYMLLCHSVIPSNFWNKFRANLEPVCVLFEPGWCQKTKCSVLRRKLNTSSKKWKLSPDLLLDTPLYIETKHKPAVGNLKANNGDKFQLLYCQP